MIKNETNKKSSKPEINGCRILKHGVKSPAGVYTPCFFFKDTLTDGRVCVTVCARHCNEHLPKELGRIENNSEMVSDYFDEDKVGFFNGTPEFDMVLPLARN